MAARSERKQRQVQRFFDGEMTVNQARKVMAEAKQDAAVGAELQSMQGVREALCDHTAQVTEEADFSQMWAKVSAGIAESRAERSVWDRLMAHWQAWVLGMASATAALLLWWGLPLTPTIQRNDCTIESLEVGSDTVGTIITIPDADESGATTVIWLSPTDPSQGGT